MTNNKKKYMREYMAIRRKEHILKNKCLDCNNHRHKKYRYCKLCLEKYRKNNRLKYRKFLFKESVRGKVKHFAYKILAFKKMLGSEKIKCCKCGIKDIRLLTINHKDGNGNKDKLSNIYLEIIKNRRKIKDLDIRCYNCNILFEYERGRCNFPEKLILKKIKEWDKK